MVPPTALDKVEAFIDISNVLTTICKVADDLVNIGRPGVENDLIQCLIPNAKWTLIDSENITHSAS